MIPEGTRPRQPRIAPVTHPTAEQSELLSKTTLVDGPPANVFATMAHNPRLLKRFNVFAGYFMAHGELAPRLRELSILRTAHRTGCLYEFAQHRRISLQGSLLDAGEIARVVTDETQGWDEGELAILEATDELCATPVLSPETWQRLQSFLDVSTSMELILLVGFYRGLAGFIESIGIELDETFGDGPEADWPAERATATGRV